MSEASFRKWAYAVATAVTALTAVPAWAEGGWACNTVRIVVPYAAGGGTDVVARIVASKLGDDLHETVVVDNRPGGKSIIAYQELLRARADGCTLLLDNSSHSIQRVYPDLPYDLAKDFRPVSLVARGPTLLAVTSTLPAMNLKGFLELGKAGGIKYGSYGVGTGSHLDGETLAADAGVPMTHVPYRGSAPALNDLMGGHIQALFVDGLAARPLIKANRIRAIAAVGNQRWKAYPDLPTFGELGYPDLSSPGWWGVFVGGKTDPRLVAQIADELRKIVAQPDTIQKMWDIGAEVHSNNPQQFGSDIAVEAARWRKVVAERHIVLE